jgi:ammonium transporter, Amt family
MVSAKQIITYATLAGTGSFLIAAPAMAADAAKVNAGATQAIAVASSISFAFIGSLVLLKITDAMVGLRVDDEAERMGLDLSEYDENAYALEA